MDLIPTKSFPRIVLAPMAGITDLPFRKLCRELGAHSATSEMVASHSALWKTAKTRLRLDHTGETGQIIVQIAGADPAMLAQAARYNVENGADIIDINMGCPAKKVCNVMAGSALLSDEKRVEEILHAVVSAVDVPVTLKIRTGPEPNSRNGVTIAKISEHAGIAALAVHGRTRACGYRGEAEYETIGDIKRAISIPVLANGDIDCPYKAHKVLKNTGADGVMIGRGALGNPWIFREIEHYLRCGQLLQAPEFEEILHVVLRHIASMHEFYGEHLGVRIARKHIRWYLEQIAEAPYRTKNLQELQIDTQKVWQEITQADTIESQMETLEQLFCLHERHVA